MGGCRIYGIRFQMTALIVEGTVKNKCKLGDNLEILKKAPALTRCSMVYLHAWGYPRGHPQGHSQHCSLSNPFGHESPRLIKFALVLDDGFEAF